jgi:Tol biopolymer transport system component
MTTSWRKMILGGTAAAVAGVLVVSPSQATFRGPNGKLVYEAEVGANRQLFTINPDGTGPHQVTHFRDSGGTNAAWSADGKKIVFTRHWDPGGPNEKLVVYTVNADGRGMHALAKTGPLAVSPAWFPNERRIIYLDVRDEFGNGRLTLVNADGTGVRPAGIPGSGGDSSCVFSDAKRVAFIRPRPTNGEQTAIFVAWTSSHTVKRITPWGSYADKIDCSPDGTRIVFSKPGFDNPGGKPSNVFTMRTDGSHIVQLTHSSTANNGADSWSPDGKKIAFVSNRKRTYQIYTMDADGTGVRQLTHGPEAHLAAWGRQQ